MADKKRKKRTVITANMVDLSTLEAAIESQGNAIPQGVATVIRLVAPVLTRIAIRFVARRFRKRISEQAIQTTSAHIGNLVDRILERAGTKPK